MLLYFLTVRKGKTNWREGGWKRRNSRCISLCHAGCGCCGHACCGGRRCGRGRRDSSLKTGANAADEAASLRENAAENERLGILS